MGRDTDTGSEVFNAEVDTDTSGEAEVKSVSHNFSSLSGSASNICWVNIKVQGLANFACLTYIFVITG